ncbi:hypothetical protein EXIGLDRAFT_315910 [Exidia glandulosa HHB12029]|uniref:Uncharacterized protein n=1 Tax=Exidia glandulosa HHB12029 TaxID=1314781 RepID=A0A165CXN5_EXIGL|nr:hypothetical protein EXIGLDRAFT_315910 [Exidia glandulosa HHB12029]
MSRTWECRPIRSRVTTSGLNVLRRLNGAARSACGHMGGEGDEGSRWTGSIALYRPGGGSERHGRASQSRGVTRVTRGDEERKRCSVALYHALLRSVAAAKKGYIRRCEGRRGTTAADRVDAAVLYTCSTQANPGAHAGTKRQAWRAKVRARGTTRDGELTMTWHSRVLYRALHRRGRGSNRAESCARAGCRRVLLTRSWCEGGQGAGSLVVVASAG